MQQAPKAISVLRQHVSKFTLYVTSSGDLVMVVGNQYLLVSPQEAQEHVDYLLGHAELFKRCVQSTTGQLVPGRINA